jgi:uncharacterized protein
MRTFKRLAASPHGGAAMVTTRRKKTVLITASSKGLGREFSKLYAAKGYRIIMVDGSRKRLQPLADSLAHEHGTTVRIIDENLAANNAASQICHQLEGAGVRIDEILTREGFRVYGPFTEKDLAKEVEKVCAEYRPVKLENRPNPSSPGTTSLGL